jgi:HAD superfamily hydrolase (TIGR01459 family)
MICANPDKMVRKGNRLLYCAGALAEKYSELGGQVLMAGKPYTPIYQLALQKAASIAGNEFEKSNILAIGDGPQTDIRGAADFGISAVLIADGVTDASDGLDATLVRVQAAVPHAKIVKILHHLVWE